MKARKRTKRTKTLKRGKKLEKTQAPVKFQLTEVYVSNIPVNGPPPPPPPPEN